MESSVIAGSRTKEVTEKLLAFDYLKTFIVTVVVFHHSILAYVSFFDFNNSFLVGEIIPYTNMINPIIDSEKWSGFDFIVMYNDSFFMSLLFFLSGFFVWKSFKKKGAKRFLKDRFIRLGLPFIFGVLLIAPLSYYPANLQNALVTGKSLAYYDFWIKFAENYFPSSGPLWFLWVLLSFNVIVAILFEMNINIEYLTKLFFKNKLSTTITLIGISTLLFLPLTYLYDVNEWTGIGPFVFQNVRIFHYFGYFACGVYIKKHSLDKTIFNPKGKIVNYWWIWISLGIASVGLSLITSRVAFPIACISITLGTIGFFLKYVKKNIRVLDNLSKNIFGIYIFHYIFTAWFQLFFLKIPVSPISKGILVFIGSFILSWIMTIIIRKAPYIDKII